VKVIQRRVGGIYPLAVVEEQLDSGFDGRPTRIIRDKFHEEPNVRVSRRLGAFTYGNGVSVSDAGKLYKACQAEKILRDSCMNGKCSGLSVVLVIDSTII